MIDFELPRPGNALYWWEVLYSWRQIIGIVSSVTEEYIWATDSTSPNRNDMSILRTAHKLPATRFKLAIMLEVYIIYNAYMFLFDRLKNKTKKHSTPDTLTKQFLLLILTIKMALYCTETVIPSSRGIGRCFKLQWWQCRAAIFQLLLYILHPIWCI